ncbi:hypothetical protein ACFYY2_04625 [Streptomyces sp. NPDC001822]|uniref:hypothetical protein n=1 Tax=Streptomyces sp. NPDC001822 TaxID=3364614 RepID=UPI0036C1A42D
MFVFVCEACGAELTTPLSQVTLPDHAHQKYGSGVQLPGLMESGTFAVAPEPSGPPWRRWKEIPPGEAAGRGIHAPVPTLSYGAPGAVVIAPGDARGTILIPEDNASGCCGTVGADGPNVVCAECSLPVASRIDDCSIWQALWLAPGAVRRLHVRGTDITPRSWADLLTEGKRTPPFAPITTWGSRSGSAHWQNYWWSWNPQWEAAGGRALAHLLAASDGQPVTVPDGLAKELFQRSLDALLPGGAPARRAALAGPGAPAPDADARILLVPSHPQTGELWAPAEHPAAHLVPLPLGVWLWLVSPERSLPVPASGGLPEGVLRDDFDAAPHPGVLFRADPDALRHTLARLPAVRRPWLRAIFDDIPQYERAGYF